jgi:hypothetical protein
MTKTMMVEIIIICYVEYCPFLLLFSRHTCLWTLMSYLFPFFFFHIIVILSSYLSTDANIVFVFI